MEFIASLASVQTAITLAAALAVFASIVTVGLPLLERDRLAARMKAVAVRRDELRRKAREAYQEREKKRQLRSAPVGFMKQVVDLLDLRRMLEAPETKEALAQAGLRGPAPLVMFIFFRFVMPIVLFVVALVYLNFVNSHGLDVTLRLAAAIAAALAGYYAPGIYVQNMTQHRQESIVRAFPDALDLLLICVESGMSVEAAFNRVAQEIGSQSIELAEEFGLTTAELSYLPDRRVAYENLAKRCGHPGVRAVATALTQAERYGTPLGTALRTMAQENRELRMQAAEKKAASLPAKLTVPMIVFLLPGLFVVTLGPAAIRIMAM